MESWLLELLSLLILKIFISLRFGSLNSLKNGMIFKGHWSDIVRVIVRMVKGMEILVINVMNNVVRSSFILSFLNFSLESSFNIFLIFFAGFLVVFGVLFLG